jgi:hypothetical protein
MIMINLNAHGQSQVTVLDPGHRRLRRRDVAKIQVSSQCRFRVTGSDASCTVTVIKVSNTGKAAFGSESESSEHLTPSRDAVALIIHNL